MQRILVVVLAFALIVAPLPVDASHEEDPNFQTTVPEPELTRGAVQEMTFTLSNDVDDPDTDVEPASSVNVTGGDAGPIEVVSGVRELGLMRDGDGQRVSLRVRVNADAEAGSYDVPLTVQYLNEDDELVKTTANVTVRIPDAARFSVDSVESDAAVGERGTVTVAVTNVGSADASDASLTLSSASPEVTLGSSASSSRYVGDWAAGETKSVSFETTVSPDADTGDYGLEATIEYNDHDGMSAASRTLRLGMTPAAEQSFAVRNVNSTLQVGQEGTVEGEVVNTGERTIDGVVVQFAVDNPNVDPVETEVSVGELGPGESASFSLDAQISSSAEGGERLFSFKIRYRTGADDVATSDPIDAPVTVAPSSDEFDIEPVAAEFDAGNGGALELTLTNTREQPLSDIEAKLYADAPVSTTDGEAFVSQLAPGESVTIRFGLSIAESADEKIYPVEVDFRYEDAEGDSRVSDTYRVPVDVSVPEDDGISLVTIGGGVIGLLLAGGGAFVFVRRRNDDSGELRSDGGRPQGSFRWAERDGDRAEQLSGRARTGADDGDQTGRAGDDGDQTGRAGGFRWSDPVDGATEE